MKNKKGITLVSLIVTIIVLIILAGVSINLTLGENGIITMAKRARENMELAKVDEERQLNELYDQIISEGGSSGNVSDDAIIRLVEFKREIASALTDMGIETAENADATTMSSNIRSLTGTSSADKVSYDNTNSGLTATNVQGAVDEINDSFERLNNNQWTKILDWVIPVANNSYTFTNSLNNYSEVMFVSKNSNPENWINSVILPVSEALQLTDTQSIILSTPTGTDPNYYSVFFGYLENDTTIKCTLMKNSHFSPRKICVYAR